MPLNFPSNPSDGDTYETYVYNSRVGAWHVSSNITETENNINVTIYDSASLLPLSDNTIGGKAFVSENNHLYIWNGSGWYNIALINTNPSITGGGAGTYELATDGTPTEITLTATDPEGIPITWSYSVTSGALGSTATVSQSDNVFTITPSTNTANSGTFELTFTASDGVNIATDVNSFTLQFITTIENSKYTVALITSVGSNGGTNSTITDGSTNNYTITANGSPTTQSFSPYRSGGYSYHSNGAQQAYTTGLDLSSGDFTIECWYYYSAADGTSTVRPVFHIGEGYPSYGVGFRRRSSLFAGMYGNSNAFGLTESDYVGQWMHLAIVVTSSNSATYYVNGVSQATQSVNFSNKANLPLSILGYVSGVTWNNFFYDVNGYITDLRVTNSAVYTGNFTPPTERLQPIANTILLTAHLPYLNDMTHAGTHAEAKPFTPYDYDPYDAATHGSSIYFDPTNSDCLYNVVAGGSGIDLEGEFTIEAWVYATDLSTHNTIFSQSGYYDSPQVNAISTVMMISTGFQMQIYGGDRGNQYSIYSVDLSGLENRWAHIAIEWTGSAYEFFIDGTSVGTHPITTNWYYPGIDYYTQIGVYEHYNGKQNTFNGYMSDFRLVIGSRVYGSNFTPPTEPLTAISGTELLISGTDASIIDKSQSNRLTLVNDTQSSTTVTKYGSSSMAFDGSDYITINHDALGTGDWTIEGWAYFNATSTQYVFDFRNGSTTSPALAFQDGDLRYITNAVYRIYSGVTPSVNTWYHFAVVKYNGTTTLYIDGSSTGTYTDSLDYVGNSTAMIGNYNANSAYGINGYIEDFRVTRGLARYTANFTPPTEALEA